MTMIDNVEKLSYSMFEQSGDKCIILRGRIMKERFLRGCVVGAAVNPPIRHLILQRRSILNSILIRLRRILLWLPCPISPSIVV